MDIVAIISSLFILYVCISYSLRLRKLRNKSFDELTESEKQFVIDKFERDLFKKASYTPETYLAKLQKMPIRLLGVGISVVLIWVFIFVYIIYFM